jgi:hypothetical protein
VDVAVELLGEFRLKVIENRVLRKITGPEGAEVRADWQNSK